MIEPCGRRVEDGLEAAACERRIVLKRNDDTEDDREVLEKQEVHDRRQNEQIEPSVFHQVFHHFLQRRFLLRLQNRCFCCHTHFLLLKSVKKPRNHAVFDTAFSPLGLFAQRFDKSRAVSYSYSIARSTKK